MSHRRAVGTAILAMSIGIGAFGSIPAVAATEPTYVLPAPEGTALIISQGNTDAFRRTAGRVATERYAFDFVARDDPERFPVLAARGGTVIGQRSGVRGGRCTEAQDGPRPDCWRNVNYVLIDHGDGTSGLYQNLDRNDPVVRTGQVISAGQRIGTAGDSGWTDEVGVRFQVQTTPAWNEFGRGAWFQKRSQPISFADPDVLTQRADGVPQTDDLVISGNTGPRFDPFRFRRRATGVPANVPFTAEVQADVSAAYDAGSNDGYGLHFAPPIESLSVDPEPTAGTEVRPLFGGQLAFAGCATGQSESLGRMVAVELEDDDATYLGILGHLSDIEPVLLDADVGGIGYGVGPNDVLGHYGAVPADEVSPALQCSPADATEAIEPAASVSPDSSDLFVSILRGATISAAGEIVGGTPISPEPFVGERGYEGLAWWDGPIVGASVAEVPGKPRARWNRETAAKSSHIPFGESVQLVAHVLDRADIAEVRFRAWYPNWPRPVPSGELASFDPDTMWRELAVCTPPGGGGGSDCTWRGNARDALVTVRWDPTATETADMEAWLPRARTPMSRSRDSCVPVSFAVEVVDTAGNVYSKMASLPRPRRCDQRASEKASNARLVYLDPLMPPTTPAARRDVQNDRGWPPVFEPDPLNGAIVWRDRSDNEDGFRIYARRSWFEADCSVTDGPWQVITEVGPGRERYRPNHNQVVNSIKVPKIKNVPGSMTRWDYAVAAFNEVGTTRLVPVGQFLGGSEAFCDLGLEPPPDL